MIPQFSNSNRMIKIITAKTYMKCRGRSVTMESGASVAIGLAEHFPLGWAAAHHLCHDRGKTDNH